MFIKVLIVSSIACGFATSDDVTNDGNDVTNTTNAFGTYRNASNQQNVRLDDVGRQTEPTVMSSTTTTNTGMSRYNMIYAPITQH